MSNVVGKMKRAGKNVRSGSSSGNYFETSKPKYGEISKQLNGNSNKEKLDAMKRLVAMMSKGRDVSEFFPDVVKNVVCSSLEVKKHVYMYLVHYADQQQDLALLSINTFQKDMENSNQLIRALALRVLSSIRVEMIAQLVVMAIRKGANDGSAFVRKTAALAVPKAYSLDREQQGELESIVASLLRDKSTMVLGAAVVAFTQVCPDKYELLHPVFRKLCNLLPDVDEWGQIATINLLIRYCRTQFVSPFKNQSKKTGTHKSGFYSSDDEEEEGGQSSGQSKARGSAFDDEELDFFGKGSSKGSAGKSGQENESSDEEESEDEAEGGKETTQNNNKGYVMDADLRLFLDGIQSLLQSRNSGVVMAVATAYYHLAPAAQAAKAGKAMTRVLRNGREIQYVMLANIATMSAQYPAMFSPYLREFFVRQTDPSFIKMLKLEVISRVANESNIGEILGEFQAYVKSFDKGFVTATIQAIGHCAFTVPEVTDRCLIGLMNLAKHSSDVVVGEAVVVIKKLLQLRPNDNEMVIRKLAFALQTIQAPAARASIVWVVGEYIDQVESIGPDVLRLCAKTFLNEANEVKLQVINLAAKLVLKNPSATRLLAEYVLGVAKYDLDYDIRDRARMLRVLLLESEEGGSGSSSSSLIGEEEGGSSGGDGGVSLLREQALSLFCTDKPTPTLTSATKDRSQFMLNSLSHTVGHRVAGYEPLPEFPEVAPETDRTEPVVGGSKVGASAASSTFYSDEEEEEWETDSEEEWETDSEEESGESEEEWETDSEEESGESEEEWETDSEEESGESEEEEVVKVNTKVAPAKKKVAESGKKSQSALDLLSGMDLGGVGSSSGGGGGGGLLMTSASSSGLFGAGAGYDVPKMSEYKQVLSHLNGGGLEIEAAFLRRASIHSATMNPVRLRLTNHNQGNLSGIRCEVGSDADMVGFDEIDILGGQSNMTVDVNVDFHMKTSGVKFDVSTERGKYTVSLGAPAGELLQPAHMTEAEFDEKQASLGGMNANTGDVECGSAQEVVAAVLQEMNMAVVSGDDGKKVRLAAKTLQEQAETVLVSVEEGKLTVNSGSMMLVHSLWQAAKNAIEG